MATGRQTRQYWAVELLERDAGRGDPEETPMEWLEYEFMRRALLGFMLIAPVCAMMGVQVVNFRMAFFSEAVAHSAFTGVALGLLLGWDSFITMLVFGVAVAWAVLFLRKKTVLSSDTVTGVLSATVVALGLLLAGPRGAAGRFESILFGSDVLILEGYDLIALAVLFLIVIVFQVTAFNRLLMIGVAPSLARSRDIAVDRTEFVFTTLLAAVVLAAIQFVGLLLVTAMLVIPAATARNVARSAGGLFWWSVGIAQVCAVAGLVVSFYADLRTGASVVLLCALCFMFSVGFRLASGRAIG